MPITLTRRIARRTALAAAAVTLSITAASCGASFDAQTLQPYQAAEGTNAASGSLAVRNLLVLASDDGVGELNVAIVNRGTENAVLTKIEAAPSVAEASADSAPSETPTTVTIGDFQELTLAPGTSTVLPSADGKPVTVTGAKPGQMIKMTLTFDKAAPITTSVPVLTLDHYSPTPRPDSGGEG